MINLSSFAAEITSVFLGLIVFLKPGFYQRSAYTARYNGIRQHFKYGVDADKHYNEQEYVVCSFFFMSS